MHSGYRQVPFLDFPLSAYVKCVTPCDKAIFVSGHTLNKTLVDVF